MFTNILFLIIALLMNEMATSSMDQGLILNPEVAFFSGVLVWVATLILFYLQKRYISYQRAVFIGQCELLISLACYHFIFTSQNIFINVPSLVPTSIIFFMWIVGVGVLHGIYRGYGAMNRQMLFLLPFGVPVLLASTIFEALAYIDNWVIFSIIAILSVSTMFLLMPLIFQLVWQCRPLQNQDLVDRFDAISRKVNFTHAGFKLWTVMSQAHTAAIIGILPRYRYVMFSERIVNEFSPENLEAILAHEIGHSKNRHLLIYPFIAFGIILISGIAAALIEPDFSSTMLNSFAVFLIYTAVLAASFRFIFGYFSRIFERQADLYIFNAGVDAAYMIEALDKIGNVTGFSHHKPNWHHYSLNQRIDFINRASRDPTLIASHNQKVRRSIIVYFIILIALTIGVLL